MGQPAQPSKAFSDPVNLISGKSELTCINSKNDRSLACLLL